VLDVVPANATTPTETAGRYLNALDGLKNAFESAANSTGALQAQALGDANSGSTQVKTVVSEIRRPFSAEGEARETGAAVAALLEMPAQSADRVIGAAPADAVNAGVAAFCGPFRNLSGQFPFDGSSSTEAGTDDVTSLLSPTTGSMWSFQRDNLGGLIRQQGSRWEAVTNASPEVASEFVRFFNRAATVSRGLFTPAGELEVPFTLSFEAGFDVGLITATIAGRTAQYSRASQRAEPFVWTGSSTGARIVAQLSTSAPVIDVPPGPWSVFHLFQQAQMQQSGPSTYRVTWPVPGSTTTITAELRYDRGIPVFGAGDLGTLSPCPSRIAR
jgi:type VI protein secretion system component VasK